MLLAALVLCAGVMLPAAAVAQPKFPALTGRVVDEANLLSAEDRRALTAELAALETKSTDQLVIVTLPSLQGYEIADFGYRLGRHWGIGQKDRKDNGVILIVAPNDRKVRIEVGRGLEATLTDALSRLVIENRILPAFRRGDFAGGIKAGAKDIQDILLGDAEAVKQRAQGARRPAGGEQVDWVAVLFFAFWVLIVFLMIRQAIQQSRRLPPGTRRRVGHDDRWIIIPGPGGSGGSGHWGGGWSGGGGGDGGFSGGGGDFGGGGATGSW